MRQDDGVAHSRRSRHADERTGPDRRAGRDAIAAARSRRRHGLSELRALSAQDGQGQYRLSALDPEGERRRHRDESQRGLDHPRDRTPARPAAAAIVRRPAAARGACARDRARSRGLLDGRALVQSRRPASAEHARRTQTPVPPARRDDTCMSPTIRPRRSPWPT